MTGVKIPIKVQKRSGFDKSHHNALTQKVGSIVPLLTDEVIPNSKVYLRYAMAGSMPPLSVDTYMKCYYDVRAFFCPMRLLYGGFESFFNDYPYNVVSSTGTDNALGQVKSSLPYFSINKDNTFVNILGDGTLSDYLGFKFEIGDVSNLDKSVEFSAMPFLCYHMICDTWFRQPNIQVSAFARPGGTNTSAFIAPAFTSYAPAMLPYVSPEVGKEVISVSSNMAYDNVALRFADGVSIFSLRNCNYDYDYFTNALPSAQLGSPLSVSTTGNTFTISALRVANSLQQFAELNGLAGSNTVDVVKARYGANLSHGLANKPVYLGGARIDIASKSVEVTTNQLGNLSTATNPFINQVGSSAGRAVIQGSDLIIDDFVAEEPGYIMVVGCIVPKVTYGSGVRRYLRHYIGAGSLTDMANPMLQNVGNQAIYQYELNGALGITAAESAVFGYTDRYAEFMTMEDEVHGLMRKGSSLEAFVAQRYWANTDTPVIGTNFLTIPNSALNNVTMVSAALSSFGFYGQFAFDYKVSQPLAQYSLPSLQNPAYEHGKTVKVHRGGFRF